MYTHIDTYRYRSVYIVHGHAGGSKDMLLGTTMATRFIPRGADDGFAY